MVNNQGCGSGSRDPNECGSAWIRISITVNNINMFVQDDDLSHMRRREEVESPQGREHSSYLDGADQINDQECILFKSRKTE